MRYLPVITEEDRLKLEEECGGTEEEYIKALMKIFRRFHENQKALSDILERYRILYGDHKWFGLLSANVLKLYRLLELAHERNLLNIPIVQPEIGAPLQEDVFRSLRRGSLDYFHEKAKEIFLRNRYALVELAWDIHIKSLLDTKAHGVILCSCVTLYIMIEGQLQADELKSLIKI